MYGGQIVRAFTQLEVAEGVAFRRNRNKQSSEPYYYVEGCNLSENEERTKEICL